jgi:cytochrome b561
MDLRAIGYRTIAGGGSAGRGTRVRTRYSNIAIILHWLIAAMITLNVALILTVDSWPDDWVRPVIDTHKSLGITVLGLALMRMLWRIGNRPPPMPRSYAEWEVAGSKIAHLAMYALIVALPLSGWMHDSAWKDAATHPMKLFGVVPWPRIGAIMSLAPDIKEPLHTQFGALHVWLSYLLYLLVALHIAAALKHQWVDRQPELQRMWFGKRR